MPDVDDSLVWQGEWATGQSYVAGDAVYSGATVYVCTADHTSAPENPPPDSDFWELAAPSSLGDAAASFEEYRSVVNSSDDADETVADRHLKAMTRLVEHETGYFFSKDGSPTTRIFRAKYTDRLDLDYEGDCPGLASNVGVIIKVDEAGDGSFSGVAWASTDYQLEPLQADKGPEPRPWNTIRRRQNGSKSFSPNKDVSVTGIYGWASVPEPIWALIIEMTGIWRHENPDATAQDAYATSSSSPILMSLMKRIKAAYSSRVTF